MRTLRSDKEIEKTQDRLNKVNQEQYQKFSRERQYQINRLSHKIKELERIEQSNKLKYSRTKTETQI